MFQGNSETVSTFYHTHSPLDISFEGDVLKNGGPYTHPAVALIYVPNVIGKVHACLPPTDANNPHWQ